MVKNSYQTKSSNCYYYDDFNILADDLRKTNHKRYFLGTHTPSDVKAKAAILDDVFKTKSLKLYADVAQSKEQKDFLKDTTSAKYKDYSFKCQY